MAQSRTSYDEPMKFTGHERDTFETMGYTYFGARYYDPELGQFTSIDKAAQFPGGFNYCGNNPIVYIDQDGNFAIWDDIIIAAVSATVSFVQTYVETGTPPFRVGSDIEGSGEIIRY